MFDDPLGADGCCNCLERRFTALELHFGLRLFYCFMKVCHRLSFISSIKKLSFTWEIASCVV